MKKKLRVLQEEISDCGVCSLLSIIRYYGGDANLEKLRINTNTTNKGVSAFDLVECAKQYGFDAKGLRVDTLDNLVLPVIAHLIINKSLSHFVVIYKIKKDVITIMDPACGFKDVSLEEFNNLFSGIVISLVPKTIIKCDSNNNILMSRISSLIKSNWRRLLVIVMFNLLLVILSIINSFYIDFVYVTNNYYLLFGLFCLLVILIKVLEYFISVKGEYFKIIIGKSLLNNFFNHVFLLPLKYIHIKDSGEIVKRINDLEAVKEVIVNSIVVVISNIIILFFIFLLVYYLITPVFLLLSIFVLLYILLTVYFYRDITSKLNDVIITSTAYNSKLQDFIVGLTSIKHNNTGDIFINMLNKHKINDLDNMYKYQKYVLKIDGILNLLFQIMTLIIYTYMFINVKNNVFSLNIIIVLSLLVNMLYKSVSDIGHIIPGIYYTKAIFNKVNDFYSMEVDSRERVFSDKYDISINNLSFGYNQFNPILNNLNIRIKEGEKVILKGESGKGKSTLCKILSGEYSDYSGSINIGDVDIKDKLLDNLTYSSQEEYIFNGTIRDNILMGRIVSDEDFKSITDICMLDRIIKNRPFGYDTYLYDGGKELSGGERNLIILARALVDNSNIYIFDESLAEVNDSVEDKVLSNIFKCYKDKTIIYVSHKNKKNYFKRVIYM